MLPRLRSSAKKAIEVLERNVSSSKHSLKQANKTPGYVRSQPKVELPPDAKATPAAMPKPPSPSTGATSSASSSSSVFSSWQFRPSIPRDVRLLGAGALSALGAGALLYSLSGNADGGGDDTQKRSNGEAKMPYFNRISEVIKFKDKFNGRPGVITVLVGPLSCGKTRFLKELAGQLEMGQNPPLVIFINSRKVPVDGPEAISKALCDEITSQNGLKLAEFPDLVQKILENVSAVAGVKTPVGDVSFNLAKLAEFIKKDETNLYQTVKKLDGVFTAMASLPRKPVIVIDEANILMDWKEPDSAERQLKQLLAFLVAISKEANLASETFFTAWQGRRVRLFRPDEG